MNGFLTKPWLVRAVSKSLDNDTLPVNAQLLEPRCSGRSMFLQVGQALQVCRSTATNASARPCRKRPFALSEGAVQRSDGRVEYQRRGGAWDDIKMGPGQGSSMSHQSITALRGSHVTIKEARFFLRPTSGAYIVELEVQDFEAHSVNACEISGEVRNLNSVPAVRGRLDDLFQRLTRPLEDTEPDGITDVLDAMGATKEFEELTDADCEISLSQVEIIKQLHAEWRIISSTPSTPANRPTPRQCLSTASSLSQTVQRTQARTPSSRSFAASKAATPGSVGRSFLTEFGNLGTKSAAASSPATEDAEARSAKVGSIKAKIAVHHVRTNSPTRGRDQPPFFQTQAPDDVDDDAAPFGAHTQAPEHTGLDLSYSADDDLDDAEDERHGGVAVMELPIPTFMLHSQEADAGEEPTDSQSGTSQAAQPAGSDAAVTLCEMGPGTGEDAPERTTVAPLEVYNPTSSSSARRSQTLESRSRLSSSPASKSSNQRLSYVETRISMYSQGAEAGVGEDPAGRQPYMSDHGGPRSQMRAGPEEDALRRTTASILGEARNSMVSCDGRSHESQALPPSSPASQSGSEHLSRHSMFSSGAGENPQDLRRDKSEAAPRHTTPAVLDEVHNPMPSSAPYPSRTRDPQAHLPTSKPSRQQLPHVDSAETRLSRLSQRVKAGAWEDLEGPEHGPDRGSPHCEEAEENSPERATAAPLDKVHSSSPRHSRTHETQSYPSTSLTSKPSTERIAHVHSTQPRTSMFSQGWEAIAGKDLRGLQFDILPTVQPAGLNRGVPPGELRTGPEVDGTALTTASLIDEVLSPISSSESQAHPPASKPSSQNPFRFGSNPPRNSPSPSRANRSEEPDSDASDCDSDIDGTIGPPIDEDSQYQFETLCPYIEGDNMSTEDSSPPLSTADPVAVEVTDWPGSPVEEAGLAGSTRGYASEDDYMSADDYLPPPVISLGPESAAEE
ncbi:hypothetical protein BDK51DRAFT_38978, partial [Blyttiomyces helicus]